MSKLDNHCLLVIVYFETDKDECTERTDSCDRVNGGCNNVPGFYECYCDEGYEMSTEGDDKTCRSKHQFFAHFFLI